MVIMWLEHVITQVNYSHWLTVITMIWFYGLGSNIALFTVGLRSIYYFFLDISKVDELEGYVEPCTIRCHHPRTNQNIHSSLPR